jgi:phage pi2 protein 07
MREEKTMPKFFRTRNIKTTLLNDYNDSDYSRTSENLMIYYRCKCGKKQVWSSIDIPECDGCYKCKTTLVARIELHKRLIPHIFITKYDENTGVSYKICQKCGKKSTEIIKEMKAVINEKITEKFKEGALKAIKRLFIRD